MSTERLYHYVYRITNIVLNKHYYGKRTSKVEPRLDLGIKYFSSSTDKAFKQDQKAFPENYKYKIVVICKNSTTALAYEIRLHNKYNVGINSAFYNKAKQTAVGFDRIGIPVVHSDKVKQVISKARKGKPLSEEHRKKLSEARKGKEPWNKGKPMLPHVKEALIAGNANKTNYTHSQETKDKIRKSLQNRKYKVTDERKKHLSKLNKGLASPRAKPANIYNYYTNELVAENIAIRQWASDNGYNASTLSQTARCDRSKPSKSGNQHQHKGLYAKYLN